MIILLLLILLAILIGYLAVTSGKSEGYRSRVWWCPVRQKWVSTPIWMGVE